MEKRKCPKITLVLVARNEAAHLETWLRAVESLVYPKAQMEYLFVDNASTDHTCELIEDWIREHPQLNCQLIKRAENNLGAARAEGVRRAQYPYVGFIDADCWVPKDWLRILLSEFVTLDSRVAAVGAAISTPQDRGGYFSRSLAVTFNSFLGSLGSTQVSPAKQTRMVSHIPTTNIVYLKDAVLTVGNFSPDFKTVCEDVELNYRLRMAGFFLRLLASSQVEHRISNDPVSWIKKIFRFGWGQFHVISRHPRHFSFRLSLPIVFGMAVLIWVAFFWVGNGLYFLPLIYLFTLGVVSLKLCLRSGCLGLIWGSAFAMFCTHFAYTSGEIVGLLKYVRKRNFY